MNRKHILTLSIVLLASVSAHADEADASQHGIAFQSVRSRAEVRAEAANVSSTRNHTPEAARPYGFVNSAKARADVRAEAADAVRLGLISHGEIGG